METVKSQIIQELISSGAQYIPSIAAATAYSVPTVNKYIAEMIVDGDIISLGKSKTQRGRQPILYGINPKARYYLGVDIKNFGLTIAIMNLVGEFVFLKEMSDFSLENSPSAFEELCNIINSCVDSFTKNKSKIKMATVNISGRIDTVNGYSHSIFNFEGDDEPLSKILSERLGIQTIIENDTRAMTFGELMQGAGKEYDNFLFINISWGLGMGIVINKEPYYGSNGFSGEIGHINVFNNEIMCHCGKKGCLETEVSGRAIQRKLIERIQKGEVSILSRRVKAGEQISISDIINAVNADDTLCIEIVENAGEELGRQLANFINIFNPQAVIIGGELSHLGEYFLSPITQAIRKYSLRLTSRNVKVCFSSMYEKSGISGACHIARRREVEC